MIKKLMLLTLPVLMCPVGAYAQASNSIPAQQPLTKPKSAIQQQFDDGTAAIAAGQWQRAFDIYAVLETNLAAKTPQSKSLPVVQLRKGQMMYRLGKHPEGEASIIASLAKLDKKDRNLAADQVVAYLILAQADELRFDYPSAIERLQSALSIIDNDVSKIATYTRLIPIRIFVDAEAALADANAALAILAQNPEANKEWLGIIKGLRGRTLTNLGRLKEARADLTVAVSRLGGLGTSKINLLDAAARSDASIAAVRDNHAEQGRILLAYTGSSQASQEGFRLGVDMEPPACGGLGGPKPDDVAVIEFNITSEGKVGQARPVYYSGDRSVAVQFARAVASWYWAPETLKKVHPFFRALTRLEMRCTTAFQKSSAIDLLQPAVETWITSVAPKTLDLVNSTNDQQGLDALNAAMVGLAQKDGADTPAMIVPLIRLSRNRLIPFKLAANYADRAYALAQKAGAPAPVLAFFANNAAIYLNESYYSSGSGAFHNALNLALADPIISKDAAASAALRLSFFDSLNAKARTAIGGDVLKPVADNKRLADNDPYKVGALTRLASVAVNSGNVEDARSLFAKTGLSAQQCALVDAKPVATKGRFTSDDYPTEAIQLGLGGWTVVEFDIGADGRTTNRRPLIAWPPFIFGEPAAKNIAGFRFQQSYRPEGGLGCGGIRQRIAYAFPY
jgi:predicted negative regulator of RcsB-dependent stress response